MGLIALLILLGIILLLLELMVIPGVGLAGLLGLASLVGSCIYAFMESTELGVFVVIINVCMVLGMITFALRGKTWKKLSLNTVIDSKKDDLSDKISVDDKGKTLTRLSPVGKIEVNGMTFEGTSLEDIIEPGKEIVVVMIENNKIYVEPSNGDF